MIWSTLRIWGEEMVKSEIKVSCNDQVLKITESPVLAAGGLNEVRIAFNFCEKWAGFIKTAIFYRSEEDVYYALLDENDTCIVPWEVCFDEGTFYFGVFGEKDGVRRTSNVVRYKVKKGAITSDMRPSDPTPDVYHQIITEITNIRAENEAFVEEVTNRLDESTKHNVASIEKTGTDGLVDTYTITFLDGSTQTYTVTNGERGEKGDTPVRGTDYWTPEDQNAILDKLCPSFTESGAVVTCEPLEGYPLQVVSNIAPKQSGTGDPSPDNVRPIIGHDGVTISNGGKNFFDITVLEDSEDNFYSPETKELTITSRGVAIYHKGYASSFKLKEFAPYLVVGQTYVMSANCTNATGNFIYLTKINTVLQFGSPVTITQEMMDSPVRWYNSSVDSDKTPNVISNIQIELGNTATAYEPYRVTSVAIPFGQTVYGGTYDSQSGVLTITQAVQTFTKATAYANQGDVGFAYVTITGTKTVGTKYVGACDRLRKGTVVGSLGEDGKFAYHKSGSTGTIVRFKIPECNDATTTNAWMAENPLTFLYEIQTPITVQLAPQEILALSGENVISCNTGDVTVTGKANLVATIEKLTNAIIALGGNV